MIYSLYSEEWWAEEAPPTATRCRATSKHTGNRCCRAVKFGALTCRKHGGAAPQTQRRARERVLFAAEDAISVIAAMMNDDAIPPAVRLAAARDMADRADTGAASKVELTVKPWKQIIGGILVDTPTVADQLSDDPTFDETAAVSYEGEIIVLDEREAIPYEIVPALESAALLPGPTSNTPRHIRERFGLRR